MATDMQALTSGFPSQRAPEIQDTRDRQRAVQGSDPGRNFESMLGRAEARHMPSKQDTPTVRNGERTAPHARQVARSTQEPSAHPSDRSAVSEGDDQPHNRIERTEEKARASEDDSEENGETQESKQNHHDQDAMRQDMLLAAMMVPAAPAAPVEQQPSQTETAENRVDTPTNAIRALSNDHATDGTTPATSLVASAPGTDAATPAVPGSEPDATATAGKEEAPNKNLADKALVQTEAKEIPSIAGHIPAPEGTPVDRTDSDAGSRLDAEHMNTALAAMTASKHNPKLAEQGPLDQGDRSTILDAVTQGTSLTEGQAGAGTGRFLDQDGQNLSDSSGSSDRSLPNQTPSVEQNARPAFMDSMNDLHQSAPSVSESSFGRSESGQTPAVLRAAESDRAGELRGMAPLSQSVTLDLDPLDMGPLRVRVMMSDQTVHAHIRTEHGELGQGLLQQGPSLESSLRTTGLEMGMLRVTVDQQQGRGDNAWMFQQQQQQGRSSSPNIPQQGPREDERGARGDRSAGSNERVSFFA